MTRPLSIRFDAAVLERLRRRAAIQDSTPSGLAQRLLDEGPRIAEHLGIVFRDGPSGQRATAAEMTLSPAQAQVALDYYGSFPEFVDAQVAENERAAAEALAAWQARQRLLA